MSDTKKIRATRSASGMVAGVIYDKPIAIAEVLIDGGHAVSVDTLAERKASEITTGGWERNEVAVVGEPGLLATPDMEPDSFIEITPDVDVQSDRGALETGITD
jgi:hypothetical protein